MSTNSKSCRKLSRGILALGFITSILAVAVNGQSLSTRWPLRLNLKRAIDQSKTRSSEPDDSTKEGEPSRAEQPEKTDRPTRSLSLEERLRALEQIIELQQRELQALRQIIERRDPAASANSPGGAPAAVVQPTHARSAAAPAELSSSSSSSSSSPSSSSDAPQTETPAETRKKVDELYKRLSAIRFSGDLRFRFESFDNQGFDNALEPPGRRRLRIRARLALDGALGKNFDWGLKLATGIFTDPITTNQTLTDFFERKPFALERAFLRYDSKTETIGVELIAGKFEPPYRRTQMVWDDDVNVEGAAESVYFNSKSALRRFKFVAFQLPFNEAAVGKDGLLLGGQAQTDWQLSKVVSANVNVGYYAWQRPDQIVIGLGAAQTQVNGGLFNGAGLTGAQNGVLGTTNRVIRNDQGIATGFVAGFHLLDVLTNVSWQAGKYPITLTFDYVRNMTGRVSDEKNGVWIGGQIGQPKERGDWLVNYYFARIEQDAVLVPFNFSDILASNSRVHMASFGYQIAPAVMLQWTGLFSQRVNTLTPNPAENRFLIRQQFDVIYRF